MYKVIEFSCQKSEYGKYITDKFHRCYEKRNYLSTINTHRIIKRKMCNV